MDGEDILRSAHDIIGSTRTEKIIFQEDTVTYSGLTYVFDTYEGCHFSRYIKYTSVLISIIVFIILVVIILIIVNFKLSRMRSKRPAHQSSSESKSLIYIVSCK